MGQTWSRGALNLLHQTFTNMVTRKKPGWEWKRTRPPWWSGGWDRSSFGSASRHVRARGKLKSSPNCNPNQATSSPDETAEFTSWALLPLCHREASWGQAVRERSNRWEAPPTQPAWGPTSCSTPQFPEPRPMMLLVFKPVWFLSFPTKRILMDAKHKTWPTIYYRL